MTNSTEHGSSSRYIAEPVRLLMAGILRNASDDIDRFAENADKDYFSDDKPAQKRIREYLRPVVNVIEWLASADDTSATLITLNNACEMLGLNPEATKELFIRKLRKLPDEGHSAIHWYIGKLFSDRDEYRKYLQSRRRSSEDDNR
jgi:hypothetical protein